MSNDYIAPIVAKLTYNGASNLKGTLQDPSLNYPLSINGNQRIFTGLGKWTHIAALGVERHLISLGLAELVKVDVNGSYSTPFEMLYITPLGREVAQYLIDNEDALRGTFRDGRKAA